MAYNSEPLGASVVSSMLDTYWDTHDGNIPEPNFFVLNDGTNSQIRVDLRRGDYLIIAIEVPAEEETPVANWNYGHKITKVTIEVATKETRQRLYDLKQEIRRVVHTQLHELDDFYRIRYATFNEMIGEFLNIWVGQIVVELESHATLLEV